MTAAIGPTTISAVLSLVLTSCMNGVVVYTAPVDPIDYVDPFIGSGGTGFGAGGVNPGAQIPFGTCRLGPDTGWKNGDKITTEPNFDHYGGYHYFDSDVVVFSHTHMVGAGVGDLGNFGIVPVTGNLTSDNDLQKLIPAIGHSLPLDHDLEQASPGYYSLAFKDSPITSVQMTAAGSHSGISEYNFNKRSLHCGMLLDVCHMALGDGGEGLDGAQGSVCTNASITVDVSPTGIVSMYASLRMAGSLTERSTKHGVMVYFAANVSNLEQPKTRLFYKHNLVSPPESSRIHGVNNSLGVIVWSSCDTDSSTTIRIDSAVSFISIEHAASNLRNQIGDINTRPSFNAVKNKTEASWRKRLSVVEIDAAAVSGDLAVKLYTAMYHANLAPSINDEEGYYLEFNTDATDNIIRQLKGTHHHSDMSIWDIHRSQMPWLSLTAPDVFSDVLLSLERMAKGEFSSSVLPRWPLLNVYTGCMVGSHAYIMFAEAVAKNQIEGVDLNFIYRAMVLTETHRTAPDKWNTLGYIPKEYSDVAASLTLAYAFDDSAVAIVAEKLGFKAEAAMFRNRSLSAYKHLWSSDRMLMCPRSETKGLECPIDEHVAYPFETLYVEGSALQWLWFVPHDVGGLVSLFPNNQSYVDKLHQMFLDSRPVDQGGKWEFGTTLANPYYWAGNEPDILAPWQFPFAGNEYHNYTAYWTRWLVDNTYDTSPMGIPGNDDFGTLSAWMVWAVIGMYPLAGSADFVIGAPRFPSLIVKRSGFKNKDLHITAHDLDLPGAIFVQKVEVDGKELRTPFISFDELNGDVNSPKTFVSLEYWMTSDPTNTFQSRDTM